MLKSLLLATSVVIGSGAGAIQNGAHFNETEQTPIVESQPKQKIQFTQNPIETGTDEIFLTPKDLPNNNGAFDYNYNLDGYITTDRKSKAFGESSSNSNIANVWQYQWSQYFTQWQKDPNNQDTYTEFFKNQQLCGLIEINPYKTLTSYTLERLQIYLGLTKFYANIVDEDEIASNNLYINVNVYIRGTNANLTNVKSVQNYSNPDAPQSKFAEIQTVITTANETYTNLAITTLTYTRENGGHITNNLATATSTWLTGTSTGPFSILYQNILSNPYRYIYYYVEMESGDLAGTNLLEIQPQPNQEENATKIKNNTINGMAWAYNTKIVTNYTPVTIVNYEEIDISNLLWEILTMPFTFFATAFNLTLFANTPFEFNIAELLLSLFAALIFIWIIKKFLHK